MGICKRIQNAKDVIIFFRNFLVQTNKTQFYLLNCHIFLLKVAIFTQVKTYFNIDNLNLKL